MSVLCSHCCAMIMASALLSCFYLLFLWCPGSLGSRSFRPWSAEKALRTDDSANARPRRPFVVAFNFYRAEKVDWDEIMGPNERKLAKDRRQQQEEEEAAEAEKELFQQYRDAKRAQKASSGIISEEMHSGPIEPASSLQLKPTENSAAVFNRTFLAKAGAVGLAVTVAALVIRTLAGIIKRRYDDHAPDTFSEGDLDAKDEEVVDDRVEAHVVDEEDKIVFTSIAAANGEEYVSAAGSGAEGEAEQEDEDEDEDEDEQ